MICAAFVIGVINTFYSFAVDADRLAGMIQSIGKRISLSLMKALAAGFITGTCPDSAYHDIAFAAAGIAVVSTAVYFTF